MEIGVATATEAPPLLTNSVIITISIAGGVLLIVTACIALGVIVGIKWKRNVYRNDIEVQYVYKCICTLIVDTYCNICTCSMYACTCTSTYLYNILGSEAHA